MLLDHHHNIGEYKDEQNVVETKMVGQEVAINFKLNVFLESIHFVIIESTEVTIYFTISIRIGYIHILAHKEG